MADNTTVHIGENSTEYVAYRLLLEIARTEDRDFYPTGKKPADREYILSTYAQCLRAARGMHPK